MEIRKLETEEKQTRKSCMKKCFQKTAKVLLIIIMKKN